MLEKKSVPDEVIRSQAVKIERTARTDFVSFCTLEFLRQGGPIARCSLHAELPLRMQDEERLNTSRLRRWTGR